MQLYNLDTKVTDKSYKILNNCIEEQRALDSTRIGEIRAKCRSILEKNGIYEDKKNGIVYQNMENELKKLEKNIAFFNENNFEEMTKNKIDASIENITAKIECLEQKSDFIYSDEKYTFNRAYNENAIRNMLFNYFETYKANTIELLLKRGYSQNTLDNIEDDILEYSTSKNSDILTEKFTQDGFKSISSLKVSLDELSSNILNEAEARFNCQLSGTVYDELKEKRDLVKNKAAKVKELIYQINSIDLKAGEFKEKSIFVEDINKAY